MRGMQVLDSLRSAISAVNPFARGAPPNSYCDYVLSPQMALAAYLSSGMLRKVIDIPAHDRVREWRDWQADKEQIEKLEAEEARLGIVAKIRQAEILRGLGGGALVLVAGGDPSAPLPKIAAGGLIAVNVVSRWQLTLVDIKQELSSPDYGMPAYYQVSSGTGGIQTKIHPSRVVAFRSDPLPAGAGASADDVFWGASRLDRVLREVRNSDNAQLWFAELVKKAKLLRIGIPGIADFTATEEGQAKLNRRVALIAEGEHTLNATVFDAGNGEKGGGETITDYQVTWTGIPAIMDAFDQRVAAVADIPFTRLMGRSPAGMNATGQHDTDNWNKAVVSGQKLELRPCLEQLDAALIPSAGIDPAKVTWRFGPLDTPTEKEEADTFDKTMDAVTKLQNTGAIPDEAFAKGIQNLMSEREWVPGLDQALAEIPEAERFGISQEPDPALADPSALTQPGGRAAQASNVVPMRRAQNDARFLSDAAPRTLYIERKLLNADEVIRWAKSQGLETTLPAEDMHVTIAFSRNPVDWFAVGSDWSGDEDGKLRVRPGGPRAVERLGEGDAVALLFSDDSLEWRHKRIIETGASWDWPEYRPHITLSWQAPDVDVAKIKPYAGPLVFGPELFSEVKEDWKAGVTVS